MKKVNTGFTVVELLLYMALFTGFLLVLTDIFVSSLNVQTSSESTSAVFEDGQYILGRLAYDSGQAQDITNPAAFGQATNNLTFLIGGSAYSYTLTNGILSLSAGNATNALNSVDTSVTSFNATKIGNAGGKPTVQVGFTVTGKNVPVQGPVSQTFQTTLGVR